MASFPQNHLQLKLHLQHHRQQSEPFRNFAAMENQISAPISFFNAAAFPEPPHPSFVHVMGLASGGDGGGLSLWEPQRKRLKELDFLENSQVTSGDLLQGSVSTGLGLSLDDGLGLSLDDGRVAAGASSGDSPLSLLPMVDAGLGRELQSMEAEMDRFIRLQGERLRQSILENFQSKQLQTLASLEDKVHSKLQEKESEVDDMNKKNTELEDLTRQLSAEVGMWQHRAKYNESMIAALKLNLQKVYASQGRENNKEGCGDSEVDDTASCCHGGGGAIDFQLLCKENRDIKESMACKVCRVNEVCMLLLPCRHLCLCKVCENKLSFCPLCNQSKLIGMEIYM